MKHTLLVAENHFRSLDFDKAFQTVVTDNHTTIEVVEVTGGETAAIEWHEWTQFGWNHWNHSQHHPFWAVEVLAFAERFHYLQALERLSLALL